MSRSRLHHVFDHLDRVLACADDIEITAEIWIDVSPNPQRFLVGTNLGFLVERAGVVPTTGAKQAVFHDPTRPTESVLGDQQKWLGYGFDFEALA